MPKYKATAYIRLSYTDDHSSESDSVSNQRKLIENFVERNPDIEVVSEKVDDGYSGIIFDRPAFKEMMQDVTDGNINCVIVRKNTPPTKPNTPSRPRTSARASAFSRKNSRRCWKTEASATAGFRSLRSSPRWKP